jgi:hypothetical protein
VEIEPPETQELVLAGTPSHPLQAAFPGQTTFMQLSAHLAVINGTTIASAYVAYTLP